MNRHVTPAEAELLQQSFARLVPISDKAAVLFYDRLLKVVPEVKPLFRGDIAGQGRKLMATLTLVVNGLNKLDAAVGAALLWTLEKGLESCLRQVHSRNVTSAMG